ncbi:hypothetical protein [Streptomyces djakartensis]|uniref:Secreted protein n=1 Tax=Streptomyces djakartensis TaxID=68193 RepID=A0ABQ2ZL97_9ACTN|nr:hypothetical protein [Streptomyces djakartensis]GGY17096.1 hypothetical protein GCM10010384_23800 [Streptomyces djakartensis]
MRNRLALAGAAVVGAVMLTGGTTAAAQAAPAPVDRGTTTTNTIQREIIVGYYPTLARCEADGENSAYSYWRCAWKSGKRAWALIVDDES